MKRVAILVPASPSPGFYSQIAALSIALRTLAWEDWHPTLHLYFGGPFDRAVHARWLPHLGDADITWTSEERFSAIGDWAQSDDVFRCAPRDAQVILTLDADTFPVSSLVSVLDDVLERNVIAGVIAHYPFPQFSGVSARDGWAHVTRAITDVPLNFTFSHTLMPPETPPELRLTPFYLNGGVVFFPRTIFDDVANRCLRLRPQLMSRMPNPDFTGQAALALAIAASGANTTALPMRYNFPNDPIADQLYPDELTNAMVFHYLRTDSFDRQRIFASAEQYASFLSLPLSGSNRLFQHNVRRVVGATYPFPHA